MHADVGMHMKGRHVMALTCGAEVRGDPGAVGEGQRCTAATDKCLEGAELRAQHSSQSTPVGLQVVRLQAAACCRPAKGCDHSKKTQERPEAIADN